MVLKNIYFIVIIKDSPPGQVFHPDIERSEIIGKGWQAGAKQQTAGVVDLIK
jgi:hypothetical protein